MSSSNETSFYLPMRWTITSMDINEHTCPSPSSLLGTFAVVNCVVSFLSVLFGHRRVVEELSCGQFGKRQSQSWKVMWIMPVGLQLAANACIALLIKKTEGYASDFKVTELMLFLVARPRLSWIVLGAFAFQKQIGAQYPHGKNGSTQRLAPNSKTYFDTSYEQLRSSPYASPDPDANESTRSLASSNPYTQIASDETSANDAAPDYPWWGAFMAQFIAEFILQIIALYIMGRTAHYGTIHNFYKIYLPSYWDIPSAARMMYSGALYYLVAGSLFLIFAFFFIVWQMLSSKVKMIGKGNTMALVTALWFLLISTWMGSWLFWAGFVKLAGDS